MEVFLFIYLRKMNNVDTGVETPSRRVDSVLGFFSCRPNWDPQPSVPHGSGGDTLACGKGDGGSQFGRGDRHYGTLGTYVLCAPSCKMYMYMHVQTVEVLYSKNIEKEYWKINLCTARYYGCNQHRVFKRKNRHFRYSEYSTIRIVYFLLNTLYFLLCSFLLLFYF